jgi:serine/tyrosine/threonine adenylyltransferase
MSPENCSPGWKLDHTYAGLPGVFYARVNPTSVRAPRLLVLNHDLGGDLGLDLAAWPDSDAAALFAGNVLPEGAQPLAQAYAGHQFGHFTMLGDGRAILLGEQVAADGTRHDIQLKGAGRTPFSRGGDGRAALGPMLREYLISEAMHALGIPTTRSLAVVATGEPVQRETTLQGAVLTRTASSHLRVGTFEYAAGLADADALVRLADHAIERHDPQLRTHQTPYLALLEAVIARQARLVASWMLVGFVHGVMNTDNMTLSGETIDYGPCAFMDRFALDTVFSSIDVQGRYAYGNQPRIAQWNLARLAEALLPLLDANEAQAIERAQAAIAEFGPLFDEAWLSGMRRKLGLANSEAEDLALTQALLHWMQEAGADYTRSFRDLSADTPPAADLYQDRAFLDWHVRWTARRARQPGRPEDAFSLMRASNPVVIPRNHKVEEALAAAGEGDLKRFFALLDAVRNPFAQTPSNTAYRDPPVNPDAGFRTFCGT